MKFRILAPLALILAGLSMPVLADKSAGNVVDDVALAGSVKAALVEAKGVSSGDINVETYKGHVLLTGFATSNEQRAAAVAAAKGVKDAKVVHDKISVHEKTSMGEKLDDTSLVARVKTALIENKEIEAGQINVEARGGVVQLGGFVKSDAMAARAVELAKGATGTKQVDNAMVAKPQ